MSFYSLPEVATEHRLNELMKDPVRWLTKEIKAGRIKGRRIGRSLAMSDADIRDFLEGFQVETNVTPIETVRRGPSAASLRRRAS